MSNKLNRKSVLKTDFRNRAQILDESKKILEAKRALYIKEKKALLTEFLNENNLNGAALYNGERKVYLSVQEGTAADVNILCDACYPASECASLEQALEDILKNYKPYKE